MATQFLIKRGSLDARDALPLVGFRAQWDHVELLGSVLDKCENYDEKRAASELVYRYLKWEVTPHSEWKRLKSTIDKHRVSLSDLDDYIAYSAKAEKTAEERDETAVDLSSVKSTPRDWGRVFAGKDLTAAAGISQAYDAFRLTEVPLDHDDFFTEACCRVPAGSEPTFVEAVGDMPGFDLYHFRSFLNHVPLSWKERPAITQAFASMIKAFCRRHCMAIKKSRYYEFFPLDVVCELSGVSEAEIVGVVLEAIGQSPDTFDADRLFSLVGLLTSKLTRDEALDGLLYGLELFEAVLQDKDGDGPWSAKLTPPANIAASIAGYIWAGLAAPPSILRWESAHAFLAACESGRHSVLKHLFDLAERKLGGPFVDAGLPFYELHALEWLLIAAARAATEFPAMLAPYADRFVGWALHSQSHVMIRAFAARAALSLIEAELLVDQNQLRKRLSRVNVTALPVVDSKSYERVRGKRAEEAASDDDGFYFGIDMGPYWYEPLGRIFALSQKSIEAEALRVIRNDLAYIAKGKWDEDERGQRKFYGYEQTSHSHGGYPRTDELRFYLSYHAMMIVAGRLLAAVPTHRDISHGEKDEFADWIYGHDLSRKDGRWLSDRRDPTPLESPAWRDRQKDKELRRVVTNADFGEALHSGEFLNVWGHWTTSDGKREQSAHVYSAFVTPEKSPALLRALQTANDVFDYGLPSADGQLEIDEPGFQLKGWIYNGERDSGLDRRDYWSGGVIFPPPVPAPYIVDLMGLTTDADRRVWKNVQESAVMVSQVWGHFDIGERHTETNPECGNRVQASLEFITEMLGKISCDLIVQVQIERRRHYRSYESSINDDNERIRNRAKLYLIRRDGSISTL